MRAGAEQTVHADREVILSSGTIGSAQILMLSGIGDPDHLKENGVTPVHTLKAVGRNMQDHLQARLVYKCNEPTLNDEVRSLFNQARIALKYALFRARTHDNGGKSCNRVPENQAASRNARHPVSCAAVVRRQPRRRGASVFGIQPWSVCQLRPGKQRRDTAERPPIR